jgi:hypothetical protein
LTPSGKLRDLVADLINLKKAEADVAQLVEQPIRNRQVTSSTLVVGSNLSKS